MKFKNIRALREDHDLGQAELGKLLHMKQNTYSQHENGVNAWKDEELIKLADFYGVSVDYLLDRTDRKEPYPPAK